MNEGQANNVPIASLCADYVIQEIGLVFDGEISAVNSFNMSLTGKVNGSDVTVNSFGWKNLHSFSNNTVYLSEENGCFKVDHNNEASNTFTGIPNPLQSVNVTYDVQYSDGVHRKLKEIRFYYTPVGPEITIQNPNRTIVKGDSFPLQVEKSEGATVKWSSLDTTVATIDEDTGNVTFHKEGTVTIKAIATDSSGNTNEATITLTVLSGEAFVARITPDTIHKGGTATLSADKTGILWKSEDTSIELNGATVTAKQNADSVEITGRRGDTEKKVYLKIVPMTVQYKGREISEGNIEMNVMSSLPVNGILGNVVVDSSDNSVVYYDPDSKTIRAGETEGTATITITDNAGTAGTGTVTLTVTTIKSKAEPEIPENAEKVQDITITKDDGWKSAVIEDLPIDDGNGHNYRYFIRETSTGSYIPVAYTSNGLELDRYSTAHLALANAVEETSSPVTLPESGSTGTKLYYVFGGILLMLTAAGYTYTKRRRWSDE